MTVRKETVHTDPPAKRVVNEDRAWQRRAESAENALMKLRQLAADLEGYDNPVAQWIDELIPNDIGEPQ